MKFISLYLAIFFLKQIMARIIHLKSAGDVDQQQQLLRLISQQDMLLNTLTRITDLYQKTLTQTNQSSLTDLQSFVRTAKKQISNITGLIRPIYSCFDSINDLNKTMSNVNTLETQLDNLNKTLQEVNSCPKLLLMQDDLQAQADLNTNVEALLASNCRNKSSANSIFQTNLQSDRWILGRMSMDQLDQKYRRRAATYDNVTDCPLETPFWNGLTCFKCKSDQIYNIQTKECTTCPNNTHLEVTKRSCLKQQFNSNFDTGLNYNLDGYQGINNNLSTCNQSTPFFNGSDCIRCADNQFFSAKEMVCKQCDNTTIFDSNTKRCESPLLNYVTDPAATWVTNNSGSQSRQYSQTNPVYSKCPPETPFFDNITCFACNDSNTYFSIELLKCIAPSRGLVYNNNTKTFVLPLKGYTNYPLGLQNITSPQGSLKNCPQITPYYDNITCIKCSQITPLFNATLLQCTQCPHGSYFINKTRSCLTCQQQQIFSANDQLCLYVKKVYLNVTAKNLVNLTQPIQDFNLQSKYKIKKNPNASFCPLQYPYPVKNTCISCPNSTPYYNVSKGDCVACLNFEKYNSELRICQYNYPRVFVNNINSKTINPANPDNQIQKQTLNSNPNAIMCNDTNPFAVDGKCINCDSSTPYYSQIQKKCTACVDNKVYDGELKKCADPSNILLLTDVSAKNILNLNDSLDSIKNKQAENIKSNPIAQYCKDPTPFSNSVRCLNCSNPEKPYFDYILQKCVDCKVTQIYNADNMKCETRIRLSLLPPLSNITGLNITEQTKNQLEVLKNNKLASLCTVDKPYAIGSLCVACKVDEVFQFSSKSCLKCPKFSQYSQITMQCVFKPVYTTNLKALNLLNLSDSIQVLRDQQQQLIKSNPSTIICPGHSPYWNGFNCVNCNDSKPLFNLGLKSCANCPIGLEFNDTSRECADYSETKTYVSNFSNSNWVSAEPNINLIIRLNDKQKNHTNSVICPAGKEFFNGTLCGACAQNFQFNVDSKQCQQCVSPKIFNNNTHSCLEKVQGKFQTRLNNTKNILFDGISYKQYLSIKNAQKKADPTIEQCPEDKPYFDGVDCISCNDNNPYFNLNTKQCVQCPQNTTYNSKLGECDLVNQNKILTQRPSIDKMLAGIFR